MERGNNQGIALRMRGWEVQESQLNAHRQRISTLWNNALVLPKGGLGVGSISH